MQPDLVLLNDAKDEEIVPEWKYKMDLFQIHLKQMVDHLKTVSWRKLVVAYHICHLLVASGKELSYRILDFSFNF